MLGRALSLYYLFRCETGREVDELSGHLMRSTAIVGTMTLISRLLGFARDMLIARHFGADSATDAFFVAFRIPNFLRRLFAEGSFAQAFVPAVAAHHSDAGRIRAFLAPLSGTLALILMLASIAGIILAPVLIFLFAPGFHDQGDTWDLSVQMLRITFPYLFFVVLTALAGAVLNSRGRFAVPAITPALLNLAMIAATLWLAPRLENPVTALAWGVLAAGLLQLLLQFPALIGAGLLPRPRVDFHDPEVRRVLKGMAPALFGVSVTQVNLLVDTLIASFLISGSVSWLYYSDRLVEFPLGLFGVAVGTAILPHLAGTHRRGDPEAFSAAIDWGLRWVVLIGLPATAGLAILSGPLLSALFQFDEFSGHDVQMASRSLSLYALGLPAFVAVKVLTPGFSARHDLQTPVRYGLYAMLVNVLLGVTLGFQLAPAGWGHAALALATALAASLNAALLLGTLLKLRVYVPQRGWSGYLGRTILASVTMSLPMTYAAQDLPWQSWSSLERGTQLIAWIAAGAGVYFASLWLSGLRASHLSLRTTS